MQNFDFIFPIIKFLITIFGMYVVLNWWSRVFYRLTGQIFPPVKTAHFLADMIESQKEIEDYKTPRIKLDLSKVHQCKYCGSDREDTFSNCRNCGAN